jgi:nicotinate-nucleotide--dimethylbenzimidazole phosphoribosyltransferase
MVMNFVQGGAAINVFCRQHNITLEVDAGVNGTFEKNLPIIHNKIPNTFGTNNYLKEPAMSIKGRTKNLLIEELHLIQKIFENGCNIIGFGEMGIGNTSSASLIMSKICKLPLSECVGEERD